MAPRSMSFKIDSIFNMQKMFLDFFSLKINFLNVNYKDPLIYILQHYRYRLIKYIDVKEYGKILQRHLCHTKKKKVLRSFSENKSLQKPVYST